MTTFLFFYYLKSFIVSLLCHIRHVHLLLSVLVFQNKLLVKLTKELEKEILENLQVLRYKNIKESNISSDLSTFIFILK